MRKHSKASLNSFGQDKDKDNLRIGQIQSIGDIIRKHFPFLLEKGGSNE